MLPQLLAGVFRIFISMQESSESGLPQKHNRVRVYIDGFNFFYGINSKLDRATSWNTSTELDLIAFFDQLAIETVGSKITSVNLIMSKPRQNDFLRFSDFHKYHSTLLSEYGSRFIFSNKNTSRQVERKCPQGHVFKKVVEKEIDVQITCNVLEDIRCDRVDTVFLVSADKDFYPLMATVAMSCQVPIYHCFPPGTFNNYQNEASVRRFRASPNFNTIDLNNHKMKYNNHTL